MWTIFFDFIKIIEIYRPIETWYTWRSSTSVYWLWFAPLSSSMVSLISQTASFNYVVEDRVTAVEAFPEFHHTSTEQELLPSISIRKTLHDNSFIIGKGSPWVFHPEMVNKPMMNVISHPSPVCQRPYGEMTKAAVGTAAVAVFTIAFDWKVFAFCREKLQR